MGVYKGQLKAAPVLRKAGSCVAYTKTSNRGSDFHIATPISEEGLCGCDGSGSGGVLEEASVSSGLACCYVL